MYNNNNNDSISSDSDIDHHLHRDQIGPHTKPVRLYGRGRSLHATFGGGKVADVLLWRNKKVSGAILAGLTIIWFLFEVAEFHLVTLLSYILLFTMVTICLWFRAAWLFNRNPPHFDEFTLPESTCRSFFRNVNWVLMKFYDISSGRDIRLFFLAILTLWMLSIIGNYVDTLNLFYIVVLCFETLPGLYERHRNEVDNLAAKLYRDSQKLYIKFEHNVLNKIPRGPAKQNKYY
ncbi:reticulon-like protein B14 [Cannabis sativa]|uniref:reticulon-like protein B14 n=2 Tax=Cannabis sativa TaxID=3483 RepID=UPI0011DFC6CC|nr:reticulon-like protein B14 [Cannabis sativa]